MNTKILVVDDAPVVRQMLTDMLGDAGYEVVTAGTYEEAKTLVDTVSPDLLIVDIRLGDYNGLQLAVRERVNHPERPVIVMTGYADPVLEAEARRQGAAFVEKPVPRARLLALIADLMRPTRAARAQ